MDVKGRVKKQQYSKIPFFVKRKEICTFYAKWSIKETLQSAAKIIPPKYNKNKVNLVSCFGFWAVHTKDSILL